MSHRNTILTAVLLSCAGAACAQSSITIYGSVDAGLSSMDNQRGANAQRVDSGNRSPDRLGFRGVEDLGGGYKALFQLESGFNVDDGAMKRSGVLFNRSSLVGLSGPMGTVTLGHMPDFMYEYLRFQSSGNMGSAYFFHPGNLDNLASQFQLDNAVKYESPPLYGFTLGAMNGFGEQPESSSRLRTYSMGLKYLGQRLNGGLAYTVSRNRSFNLGGTMGISRLLGQTLSANPAAPDAVYVNFASDLTTSAGVNASYKAGAFTPHAMYSRIKLENQAGSASQENLELGSDYTAGQNTVGLSVARSRFEQVSWNQLNLIDMYRLSQRTTVYAAAAHQRAQGGYAVINSLLPSDDKSQTVLRVGVHHLF